MFLVAIDAHLKWPEVYAMLSTTAERTIEVLHHLFAAYSIPEQIVTDNGPQFVAQEFLRRVDWDPDKRAVGGGMHSGRRVTMVT